MLTARLLVYAVITFAATHFYAFPSINQSFDFKFIKKSLRDYARKRKGKNRTQSSAPPRENERRNYPAVKR